MSFVLSGPVWCRQLKQTRERSGAGVIECHMWMNKGATLKPFVVFVNVFHLSLKRLNDFAVSWCMWPVALQNEGNAHQWLSVSCSRFWFNFFLILKLYLLYADSWRESFSLFQLQAPMAAGMTSVLLYFNDREVAESTEYSTYLYAMCSSGGLMCRWAQVNSDI